MNIHEALITYIWRIPAPPFLLELSTSNLPRNPKLRLTMIAFIYLHENVLVVKSYKPGSCDEMLMEKCVCVVNRTPSIGKRPPPLSDHMQLPYFVT